MSGVNKINKWVEDRNERGSHVGSTRRKLGPKLSALTKQFQDVAAYVQAPLIILPMEDGTEGVGIGEATGEIVGFVYRKYSTINDQMEEGPIREGIVAIIATGGTNVDGLTTASWNRIIPEQAGVAVPDDFAKKGVVPMLIPIIEGTHFTQIDNSIPLHFNPSHLLTAEAIKNPTNGYRDYVARIENLMNGKYTMSPGMDKALMSALYKELNAMNNNCPFIGQDVEISASYMRTLSQINIGEFIVFGGAINGILRKFIYEPYFPGAAQPHLKARGAVQAVVYPPEVAKMVYGGQLSPQEADKMAGTIFVPLDQEYTLRPLN